MCPMSSASLLETGEGLLGAWENQGRIITAMLSEPETSMQKTDAVNAKHPVLARNNQGETLVVCIIGSGWSKPGRLHWQLSDTREKMIKSGDGEKLPVWSYAAAYAQPDGRFVILH